MSPGSTDAGERVPVRERALRKPTLVYWVIALTVFAAVAFRFGLQLFLHEPSRDLWQHLAAVRALLESPTQPENPFVPTSEGSRHFQPYWFGMALIARGFGWTEWQAVNFAAYISLGVLAVGIYLFGHAYFGSRWGPLALLSAMLLGWLIPLGHTGLHSLPSLFEGAAYPACLLIGLTLVLWALIIQSTARPAMALIILPLVAFMFATHQLGAGIALIGAAFLAFLWPDTHLRNRAIIALAIAIGLAISAFWPFFNPFELILKAGNPTWVGPPDFYSPVYVGVMLTPAIVGIAGLVKPVARGTHWPMLAIFATYVFAYLAGLAGIMVASRFLMPMVLVLHIGLAALVIRGFRNGAVWKELVILGAGWACFVVQASMIVRYYAHEIPEARSSGNVYQNAVALTSDIPDAVPIAAYDVAVWPVVAAGQKALSVPWPEPLISNLDERQAVTESLFDPSLNRTERIAIARRWGVRTLIIDDRYAFQREPSPVRMRTLQAQARSIRRAGHMWRFDLE